MSEKGQTATSAGAWATSACPSTTDVRLVPPQSVARSFRERDFVRGPRDRGLRAHFRIFVFQILFPTMPRKAGRDIDEDASWNALVELVGFEYVNDLAWSRLGWRLLSFRSRKQDDAGQ